MAKGNRTTRGDGGRKPPVKIPLSFDKAVEGLLAVDPKGPVESARKKPAKKKPGRKK